MEAEIDTNLIAAFATIALPERADDTLRADLDALARLLQEAPANLRAPALVFRGRDGTVRAVPITEELSCGRASDCGLRFTDLREISRHHFTIRKESDIYWLVDHSSFNGTKIRGRPIKKHELRDGDLINAAGIIFAFIRE
jgi:pSer/pThr/pTyr-binding forkhead associated (FHA) protein